MGNNCAFLEVKDVTKQYLMGEVIVKALNKVNLTIAKGELLVVLGPSGSGKSTLMNMMGGMDVPTEGNVYFQGQDISLFKEKQMTNYRKENIGFIFQFYNLIPSLTALENVTIASQLVNNPLPAVETLSLVGLKERARSFPAQLSGGEQQRVAIARAIIKNPEMLLCDEPTGALDSTTGKKVLKVLQDINARWNKTIVIITHNADIAKMAKRVIKMADGRIVEDQVNPEPISAERIVW